MSGRNLRTVGLLLALLVGAWAGLKMHAATKQPPAGNAAGTLGGNVAAGLRVPAGESSPPSAGDLDSAGEEPATVIPDELPDFSLNDRTGTPVSISRWGDKSLILNFWATWCAPCRREIPLLEALYGEWSSRGVEIVGIAVDHRDQVAAYASTLKITYPLLVGEQDALNVAAALGVESPVFPFTVFTDRRRQVVALYVGELHKAQADLILSVVNNLNENRLQLPEARRELAQGLAALGEDRTGF